MLYPLNVFSGSSYKNVLLPFLTGALQFVCVAMCSLVMSFIHVTYPLIILILL